MRWIAALIAALALCGPAFAQVPVQGFRVVKTYPHDPTAFTEGLFYRDGDLFESTGRYPSDIRRVRLRDGQVIQKREIASTYFGEGIIDWGGRLISLTWRNGIGFFWSLDGFEPQGAFTYPGEGWGVTRDDRRLIMSDGTDQLRFLDPTTMAETGRVSVTADGQPVDQINELEWIDGEVWANIWQTDRIARIDPATGQVKAWIDLSGLYPLTPEMDPADDVLNGIAWDRNGDRIFVTGKRWSKLFEIRVVERR
jgi:glutaminyl-peptide cyclotransferase